MNSICNFFCWLKPAFRGLVFQMVAAGFEPATFDSYNQFASKVLFQASFFLYFCIFLTVTSK